MPAAAPIVLTAFALYETQSRLYFVGSDRSERSFRVLQVDRRLPPLPPPRCTAADSLAAAPAADDAIAVVDDGVEYTLQEKENLLAMIGEGNRAHGGLKCIARSLCGIVGFVRFASDMWYVVVATKRSTVAIVGGHRLYHIDGTEIFMVTNPASLQPDSALTADQQQQQQQQQQSGSGLTSALATISAAVGSLIGGSSAAASPAPTTAMPTPVQAAALPPLSHSTDASVSVSNASMSNLPSVSNASSAHASSAGRHAERRATSNAASVSSRMPVPGALSMSRTTSMTLSDGTAAHHPASSTSAHAAASMSSPAAHTAASSTTAHAHSQTHARMHDASARRRRWGKALQLEDQRLISIFKSVDMGRHFYFSYTYDITHTLQNNMRRARHRRHASDTDTSSSQLSNSICLRCAEDEAGSQHGACHAPVPAAGPNGMFVWNARLLDPVAGQLSLESPWLLRTVHGYVDQAKIAVYGRIVQVTLIARRSRVFAGARYYKRGVDSDGFVANDVETEQIVHDAATTGLFYERRSAPSAGAQDAGHAVEHESPGFTAFVQHRGSIPLGWSQDRSNLSIKPPIVLTARDPYYATTARHFAQLFHRYGTPVVALNLVKRRERTPRESAIAAEFRDALGALNRTLAAEQHRIRYIEFDMSRSRQASEDVIGLLEEMAEQSIALTGFYHSGHAPPLPLQLSQSSVSSASLVSPALPGGPMRRTWRLQHGVVRSNCIDCLDRTNTAQFALGKNAFLHQLRALGVVRSETLHIDSDAVQILVEMYNDLGNTIALQYGGSLLVNTIRTYRHLNEWTSHSRDMIESFRRYLSNSFTDAEKQEAIDLFLAQHPAAAPSVLSDDTVIKAIDDMVNPQYARWWNPPARGTVVRSLRLDDSTAPAPAPAPASASVAAAAQHGESATSFWNEYYRPGKLTVFDELFDTKMNSSVRYARAHQMITDEDGRQSYVQPSPFAPPESVLLAAATQQHQHQHQYQHTQQQHQPQLYLDGFVSADYDMSEKVPFRARTNQTQHTQHTQQYQQQYQHQQNQYQQPLSLSSADALPSLYESGRTASLPGDDIDDQPVLERDRALYRSAQHQQPSAAASERSSSASQPSISAGVAGVAGAAGVAGVVAGVSAGAASKKPHSQPAVGTTVGAAVGTVAAAAAGVRAWITVPLGAMPPQPLQRSSSRRSKKTDHPPLQPQQPQQPQQQPQPALRTLDFVDDFGDFGGLYAGLDDYFARTDDPDAILVTDLFPADGVLTQMMEPEVPLDEQLEYENYVGQFSDITPHIVHDIPRPPIQHPPVSVSASVSVSVSTSAPAATAAAATASAHVPSYTHHADWLSGTAFDQLHLLDEGDAMEARELAAYNAAVRESFGGDPDFQVYADYVDRARHILESAANPSPLTVM